MSRSSLNNLTASEKNELSGLVQLYATPAVVDQHLKAVQSGIHNNPVSFLAFHREYIGGLESFLSRQGYSKYAPLPAWNPIEPIPREFNIPSTGPGKLVNLDPKISFSPEFDHNNLNRFRTETDFGMALMARHNTVHAAISGIMNTLHSAPKAPIFWPFHAYIDDIWVQWESLSVTAPSVLGLTLSEAYLKLMSRNLTLGSIRSTTPGQSLTPRRRLSAAIISAQDPEPGTKTFHGSVVNVDLITQL